MKGTIGIVLILLLTAFLLWGWVYLSTHDSVSEVIDVSTLRLGKGRIVHLIGVAPSAVYAEMDVMESEGGMSHAPVALEEEVEMLFYDTTSVEKLSEEVLGKRVVLKFTYEFNPDTSSADLHAYVTLEDGTDLNAWVLSEGLAKVNTAQVHPREVEYASYQAEAKLNRRGIWSALDSDSTSMEGMMEEMSAEEMSE